MRRRRPTPCLTNAEKTALGAKRNTTSKCNADKGPGAARKRSGDFECGYAGRTLCHVKCRVCPPNSELPSLKINETPPSASPLSEKTGKAYG